MTNVLDWLEILSQLTPEEKENFAWFCQEKYLKAWEVLFEEGDDWEAMYILKTGECEVSKFVDWRKIILWRVVAEETLWEMALFWGKNRRMATATAMTDTNLIVLLSFSVFKMAEQKPNLLRTIQNIIEDRNLKNKVTEDSLKKIIS